MIKVLSLGAGVQSTTVLLLSLRGELPKLDHAIFADTGWEPKAVYEHLEWLKGECKKAGLPLHVVSAGNIKEDALDSNKRRWASMPVFVSGNGAHGSVQRQCTREYKVDPLEVFVKQDILNLKPRQRAPKQPAIEMWFGISFDEIRRMKEPRHPWKTHQYPLVGFPVEMMDKPWRRSDCVLWLRKNYPDRAVPRSACIGCPFHSDREWKRLRDESPLEWNDACGFDEAMRNKKNLNGQVFLHRSMKPLRDVDLRDVEDAGQMNMFNNECEGMCGV